METMIRCPKNPASPVAILLAAGAGLLLLASCGAERHTTTTTRTVIQEPPPPPPPAMTAISFLDLRGVPTADPTKEKVIGTIVNHGDKAVSKLSIRVEGLDRSGLVVTDVTTPPIDQTIGAFGGRMQFEAILPRSPTVEAYHAVAIAR